jgi:hypothetical protein
MSLTSHHRPAVWTTVSLVATLAACNDGTAPTRFTAPSSPLLTAASSNGGQFEDFTPLASSAACVAPPPTLAGFDTYKPFVLPEGYSQKVLATEIGDFRPVAGEE